MPTFEWRRYETRYFGPGWLPIAQVELRAANGEYQEFAFQFDSGAVVSILRRSVADLLGLKLEGGRKIEMGGVGGGRVHAYVHELETRLGDGLERTIPFAIAEIETVPNLLGRVGVFDELQVFFDATFALTSVAPKWLDADHLEFWRRVRAIEHHVMVRWNTHPIPLTGTENRIESVARRMMSRAQSLLRSLTALMREGRVEEMALILRALLEVEMQFQYLLKDPAQCDGRAQDYLDFYHVTRWKQYQATIDAPSGQCAALAKQWTERYGLEALAREYKRVEGRFKRKSGTWDCWYRKNVRELAEDVGRESEYLIWYEPLSSWGHGDPFANTHGVVPDGQVCLVTGLGWFGAMLKRVADVKSIILSAQHHADLSALERMCAAGPPPRYRSRLTAAVRCPKLATAFRPER